MTVALLEGYPSTNYINQHVSKSVKLNKYGFCANKQSRYLRFVVTANIRLHLVDGLSL